MGCRQCGKGLTGRQRKFCSDQCMLDYHNMIKIRARADKLGLPVGHKPCSVCGTVFRYEHNGNKFCSAKCRLTRKKEDKQYKASKAYNATLRAKRYGITPEKLKGLEEAAGGKCEICGISEEDAPKGRLHVDHCHESGGVRGLLCQRCNQALGMFFDDVSNLEKAISYLKKRS